MSRDTRRLIGRFRLIAATSAAALAAVAVAGCGAPDESDGQQASACHRSKGKVTLTYWSWVPGIDKTVALWNRTHPDIQVKLNTIPSGSDGGYAKMSNAVKAGTAPDLGQIEYDTLPSFRLQGGLRDIGPCGAAAQRTKFQEWAWKQVSFGEDAAYAVPQDTGPMALYYRKDLFAKYGIEVPKTWKQFEAAARKVHKADPSVYLTSAAAGRGWFAGMAWQNDARWFGLDKDTWKVSVDDQGTRQTAAYWQRLRSQQLVSPVAQFTDQWNKAAADGKILSWPSSVWAASLIKTDLPKTAGKWAVAPLPQWSQGEAKSGNWGGSATAVFKDSKHPYEAAQFALWLSTNAQALKIGITKGGLYPAAKSGLRLPELGKPDPFYGGQNVYDVFAKAAGQTTTRFVWGPAMTKTYSALDDAANASANGDASLTAGLSTAQRKTVDAMQQQGLKVQQ
jgi:multiple sugar transport system substrate-binding protein